MPVHGTLVLKIVSGGQTGVDRGALDAAIELGMDHGGKCPRGLCLNDPPNWTNIPANQRLPQTVTFSVVSAAR